MSSITKFTALMVLAMFIFSGLAVPSTQTGAAEPAPLGPGDFEHFVIGEEFTATWCGYCPAAAEQLNDIYHNDGYEFYFVALICDVNDKASDRMGDYPTATGYPTVEFDGGYREESGAQGDKSAYQQAIEESGARSDTPVSVELSMSYEGDSAINVKTNVRWDEDSTMMNPSQDVYLRVYITEIESRYINNDGDPYHFGFLDYAFDESLSLEAHEWWEGDTTWVGSEHEDANGDDFGDIDYNNIAIMAAVFNAETGEDEYNLMAAGTIAPELDISAPGDGSSQNEDFTLSASSSASMESGDPTTVSTLEYSIDDGSWKSIPKKSGNNYEVEVDTSSLDDGDHTVTVRSTDSKGTTNEKIIDFDFSSEDTKAPEVRNISPAQDDTVFGDVEISADVTDSSSFTVSYQIDEGSWQPMSHDSGDRYLADWDTTTVTDDSYVITIKGEDEHGNSAERSVDVQVENLEIELVSPEEDSNVANMVEVEAQVDHTMELTSARYKIDSESWQDMDLDGDSCTADWNSRDVDNGRHSITVQVTDSIGNQEEADVLFNVDNGEEDTTPPELDILEPAEDDTLSEMVTLQVEATDNTDIYKVEFKTSGGSWQQLEQDSGDSYVYDWNTRELENGDYTLIFRAQDSSSNSAQKEIDVTIANQEDTTEPALEALYPVEETVVSVADGNLMILAHATDDKELDSVDCALNGGQFREMTLDSESSEAYEKDVYRFDFGSVHQEFRELEDGSQTLEFRAKDGAGNEKTLALEFTTDSSAPDIQVQLPAFAAGELVVDYNIQDAHELADFSCGLGEDDIYTGEVPEKTGQLTLDISHYDDGEYDFWLDAVDEAGNSGSFLGSFVIDNTAPVFELVSPDSHSLKLAGEQELVAKVVEEHVDTVSWAVGDDFTQNVILSGDMVLDGEFYTGTLDSTFLPDGRHDIVFEARDLAGNFAIFEVGIMVDNSAPELISMAADPEEVEIYQDILVEAELEDASGLDTVTLWYEICQGDTCLMVDEVEMEEKRGVYQASMSFDIWGSVSYRVIALDSLGNQFRSDIGHVEVLGDDGPVEDFEMSSGVLLSDVALEGDTASGIFSFGGGAYDAGNVKLKLDDGEWISVSTSQSQLDSQMEDFTLTDLDGNEFTLSEHRGKVVFLDFMASWCGGCKTLSDNLDTLKSQYGDNIVIFSIDADPEDPEADLRQFAAEHGGQWPYAYDTVGLADQYAIDALPRLFVLTPDGYISGDFTGALDVDGLEAALGKALSLREWSYQLDTTILSNGQHTLTVETEDGSHSETLSFTVQNGKAQEDEGQIDASLIT